MNNQPTPKVVFQSSLDSRKFRIIQNHRGDILPSAMDFRLEAHSTDGMGGDLWEPTFGPMPGWVEVLVAEYIELKKLLQDK